MSENNSAVKATKTIHDMTTGSPAKLIVQFMIPMFLGNIFQQFYNVADSIIAGQFLGVRALAAIGSTGSLMFFVTGWLNGLSSGFAILVSQWFGAKQYDRMRHYVAMSVYLALGFALLMTIGFGFANEPILRLMNYSDQIMPDVKAYMGIIYAGLIVTAAYNSLAAFLRALGDSKSPLYFLIISAVINVALDVAFIIFGGMGVEGCAYATVIAQGISAVLCLIYIIKKFPILHLEKEDFKISLSAWGRLLALGIPMALQFSITAIGTIIVQGAINVYGENAMAGFSAASKLQNIIMTVFVAFGATIATYVGQNRGAGKMDRVHKGVRTCMGITAGATVLLSVILYNYASICYQLFTTDAQVVVIGEQILHFLVPTYFTYIAIEILSGTLRGIGDSWLPMIICCLGICVLRVVWILTAVPLKNDILTIVFSYPLTWTVTSIAFIVYYVFFSRLKTVGRKR